MFIYIYVYVIFNNDLKPKEALWRKISTYFIMNIFLQIDDTLQIMEIYYEKEIYIVMVNNSTNVTLTLIH
jgi:hypothetical protein